MKAFERSYPMRVLRYRLRSGSGGDGEAPGGEGIEKVIQVLEPATLSLMTPTNAYSRVRPCPLTTGLVSTLAVELGFSR